MPESRRENIGSDGVSERDGKRERDKKRIRKIDVKAETGKVHQGEEGILVI